MREDEEKKEEMTEEAREAMKGDVDALTEVFKKALGNDKLEVRVEKLKNEAVSSMITVSEDSRRMQEIDVYKRQDLERGAAGRRDL